MKKLEGAHRKTKLFSKGYTSLRKKKVILVLMHPANGQSALISFIVKEYLWTWKARLSIFQQAVRCPHHPRGAQTVLETHFSTTGVSPNLVSLHMGHFPWTESSSSEKKAGVSWRAQSSSCSKDGPMPMPTLDRRVRPGGFGEPCQSTLFCPCEIKLQLLQGQMLQVTM